MHKYELVTNRFGNNDCILDSNAMDLSAELESAFVDKLYELAAEHARKRGSIRQVLDKPHTHIERKDVEWAGAELFRGIMTEAT